MGSLGKFGWVIHGLSIANIITGITSVERGCFNVGMYMSSKSSGCDDEDEWFYDSIKR